MRFDNVGLRVTQLRRSIRFYTKALGMRELRRGDTRSWGGGIWVLLEDPRSRRKVELNWYPKGSMFGGPYRAGDGVDHLDFTLGVATQRELERVYRQLLRQGAKPTGYEPANTGDWMASVTDPDGIWITIRRRPTRAERQQQGASDRSPRRPRATPAGAAFSPAMDSGASISLLPVFECSPFHDSQSAPSSGPPRRSDLGPIPGSQCIGCIIYILRVWYFTILMDSPPTRIDVTAPVHYRILRQILTAKEPFLQRELALGTGAATGQVSRLVRWLEAHHHVTRRRQDGRYEVAQPAGLVLAMFPYQRVMSQTLEGTVKVRGSMDEIGTLLSREGATLCLESALAQYSGFFRPDRLAVYHRTPKKLISNIGQRDGGLLSVQVYRIDIPLEGDQEGPDKIIQVRRTTRFRTLVDLVCDNRAYAAKDLFAELWGVQIG